MGFFVWTLLSVVAAIGAVFRYIKNRIFSRDRRDVLLEMMNTKCSTFEEWSALAEEYDALCGWNEWKRIEESDDYDYELIHERVHSLKEIHSSKDLKKIMWTLRAELHRNFGGICNPQLYQSMIGTKNLIQEYVQTVCDLMITVRDFPTDVPIQISGVNGRPSHVEYFDNAVKHAFFRDTSFAFGRSALLLSGGGSLGIYHLGVVKALFNQHLLPRIISGSSAGALLAALICTRTDDEVSELFESGKINLQPFDKLDNSWHLLRKLVRFIKTGVLFDIRKLQECVIENLGDITFEEAYKRTGKILNITVDSTKKHSMPSLLNYITAPHVLIWSAACASCALPGVFEAVPLMAKDEKGAVIKYHERDLKFRDGSFWADLPLQRLSELFNVNLFIVSQVNPHVIPFISDKDKKRNFFYKARHFLLSELRNRILQLYEYKILSGGKFDMFKTIISQKYEGDITILPATGGLRDYLSALSNPTEQTLSAQIPQGQRRTWPKMSIIENHCKVERILDSFTRSTQRRPVGPTAFRSVSSIQSEFSNGDDLEAGTLIDEQAAAAAEMAFFCHLPQTL